MESVEVSPGLRVLEGSRLTLDEAEIDSWAEVDDGAWDSELEDARELAGPGSVVVPDELGTPKEVLVATVTLVPSSLGFGTVVSSVD